MKVQLENIGNTNKQSFRFMFNPRLADLFFWHVHPEYELVYIETEEIGSRQIGHHSSNYTNKDLVLIGSNIPHLNFDYGLSKPYRKVVIHFDKEFIEKNVAKLPELIHIFEMFKTSARGLVFSGDQAYQIGQKLFDFEGKNPFQQYVNLMNVLDELSKIEETQTLHTTDYSAPNVSKVYERLQTIYAFVDKNYHRKIQIEEVATLCNLSKEAFCRFFKSATTYSFVEFLNRYRISHSKRDLMNGYTVSEACYRSGFESLSYYNRVFTRITQKNPSSFRKKYS